MASVFLLSILCLLLFVDWVMLRRTARRVVLIEIGVFALGAVMVAFPGLATALATSVGIGRGVDFVLYPTIIWLVRESILARHARLEETERLTGLVRSLAVEHAQRIGTTAEGAR